MPASTDHGSTDYDSTDDDSTDYDVVIIGSGAGGGTLAHRLAPSGKRILILERGDWLPREVQNWDATAVFVDNRYVSADTWYDARGRIVFTVSKGLVGVGLPRKGNPKKGIVGWEDVRDQKTGTVSQTITDDTQPGGPVERTIVYHAPFDRCSREDDYRIV